MEVAERWDGVYYLVIGNVRRHPALVLIVSGL